MTTTPGKRVTCVVAALAIVSAPRVLAQEQDRPTFRSGARLVEVSVVVTDRNRTPVDGLTAADFQVFDDGKPQQVQLFSIERVGAPAAAPAAVASARHPREFSNSMPDTGSVTIILFDQFNTPSSDRMYARDHVLRFLEQIRPEDRVGLYALDSSGGLRIVHDYTSDASALVRVLAKLQGSTSMTIAGTEDAGRLKQLEAEMDAAFGESRSGKSGAQAMKEHFVGIQGVATLNALEAIGRHLSGIQNRKNLIWVSSGFPLIALDYAGKQKTKAINRATRALNDANVAVYTVDARGLRPAFSAPGQQTITPFEVLVRDQDILLSVAENTGGRAFLNTNDIQGAVRRAADDARMTYVLGYYPTNDVWDGRFHQIGVKVSRPGLEVRYRKGYFAVSTEKQASGQRTAALQAAVSSPLDASGLGLTLRIDPVVDRSADYRITVRVDAGAIALEPLAGESRGALDVIVAQIRADGAEVERGDHTVDLRLSGDRLQQFLSAGLKFDRTVTLRPDTERLRIIVRDVRTGALGAIGVSRQQIQAIPR